MKGLQLGDGHNQAAEFDGYDGARRMPRDLFPLPGIAVESVQQTSLSRRCRRRIEKRSHVQREVDGCLAGLNQLYSFAGSGSDLASEREVNSSQISSIEFVKACVDDLGPPGQLTGSEALDALRVSEGYEELPTSSTLGSYNPEAVSLPAGEVFPIDLAGLWGDDGRDVVQNFIDEQLLDENAALSSIECLGPARVYEDPKLRSRSAYAGFIKRLASLGLVDFSTVAAKEEVGIFFVKKKQNKLRLIFDCRRSNRWFREPTPVTLTTGESLRRIELGAEDRLYVCNADLANAFYTLAMPKELRQFFGLRSVLAGDVGIDNLQGVAVKKNQRIFPRIAVLPMGWSWALYWCQHIHQNIAERSGLTQEERLQDFRAAHSRGFWHVQYVDNLHVIGTNKTEVETRFWKAVEELKKSGLTVHEEEVCDSQAKVLGWEYESKGVMRPSRSRVWKIRLAIREVLRRGCLSGVQLERLIGHITFVSLGRRELLSIFGECYTFIRRNYKCNVPMWKSVRKELQTWDRLSPLIVQDLRSKWSEHVCAVDASEWGLGVVEATMDVGSVQKLGSFSERWRFKSPDFSNARLSVSQEEDRVKWLQELEDESIVVEAIPASFENVQFRHVTRYWSLIGRYRWKRIEAMPVLEAKANLYAVKHAVRRVSGHRKRHLVLTDSMTAALAIGKGRSASWKMRAVVQKISAILLATGSSLQCRWIPSEWMSSSVAGEKNNQGTVEAAEGVRETGGSIIKHATDLGHRDGKDESIGKEDKEKCKKEDKGYGRKTIRHVHPSSLKCETRHTAEVPRTLEQPDGVVQAEPNERENHRRHRHLHREVPGGVVFGRRRSECGELYVVASVNFHRPELRGSQILPRTHQSLKGWRVLCPPRSRMPLPYEVICLLSREAVLKGKIEISLALLLTFFCYLRPTEYEKLRVCDIVAPVAKGGEAYRWWSVLLHPMEMGIPSKTAQWDEALRLDLPYQQFLGEAMQRHLRLKTRPKEERAFKVTSTEVNQFMTSHWKRLGLLPLHDPHLYRLRHGGASHDIACKHRTLQAVQVRGRWMALKSVKNYEKGSRLAQLFGSLSSGTQKRCLEARKTIGRDILSRL